jgi:hypothetical protein
MSLKTVLTAMVLVVLATLVLDKSSGASVTASGKGKWEDVQIVSYASGLTGFFDKSSGRLYLYGSDIKTPFAVSELRKLGEPLQVVKAPGS